jgi:hypothetical protein
MTFDVGHRVAFQGGELRHVGEALPSWSVRVTGRREIDLTDKLTGRIRLPGIYRREGDALTLCLQTETWERPEAFSDPYLLITLERREP